MAQPIRANLNPNQIILRKTGQYSALIHVLTNTCFTQRENTPPAKGDAPVEYEMQAVA
jgi:hypothetical protein